jgi:hypothetical protein
VPHRARRSAEHCVFDVEPISDLLICLDDFERMPKDGMQMEEVLGFVTTLKEEKNCKVVLIFNDEELGERSEVYRLQPRIGPLYPSP